MLSKQRTAAFLIFCLMLSGCSARQTSLPTPVPSYTPPSSPTPTQSPAPEATLAPVTLPTATISPTATPPPVCNPGRTVESPANGSLPSHIDILKVTTTLKGSTLTVVFTMSWLPDKIGINRDILGYGSAEIAWGVAIDADNDPNTGASIPLTGSGFGYEYALQAVNYKEGEEQQGDIQSLFSDKTDVWEYYEDGSSATVSAGKIKVDIGAATLSLSGNIQGISKESYLHYYAIYFPTNTKQLVEELCQR